ncbi:MAG: acyltransferase family protein [Lachnospiraceae bacterium]|nr:acyltransferase family protein [Lachnospiraceae bacterium]
MEKKIEPSVRILSALAIIFVVAGHADFGVFDVAGMFPYYSFHVGVFVFISGYFYREENELQMIAYIKRKAMHLLLPYYLWNLFYGVLTTVLRGAGFSIGSPISLYNFFLEPFLGGHQYGLNFAAWFVPVLFLLELINVLGRKILGWLGLKKEGIIFVLSLVAGMITVVLSQRGSVWGYYRHIGCLLFLFPVLQAGSFYKNVLKEKIENISYGYYFLIICSIQFIVLLATGGRVAYSSVWCSGFLYGPLVPYITTFLGIGFWLGISRILAENFKKGTWLYLIGEHSFDIMMHHVLGFFILNTIFYGTACLGLVENFLAESYFTTYEYRYLLKGMEMGKWLYLIFGIIFSLFFGRISRKIKGIL